MVTQPNEVPLSRLDLRHDVRWYAKRNRVLRRDDFTCHRCLAQPRSLSVHHTYYASGRAPWEYEDWSLRTLCGPCHGVVEGIVRRLERGPELWVLIRDDDDVDRICDAAFGPFSEHLLNAWHNTKGYWVDLRPLMAGAF